MCALYLSVCARASYPDVEKFETERADIEKSWPAYAGDKSMCQVPHFLASSPDASALTWSSTGVKPHLFTAASQDEWGTEGERWRQLYDARHQYVT